MNKIKISDEVIVIAGADKGKIGKVKWFNGSGTSLIIEGVNTKKKSVKPTQEMPEGGFLDLERPIHISNVMHYSNKLKVATKVKFVIEDGKKARVLVRCGTKL
jgi:large subunit ribosomal protein L24